MQEPAQDKSSAVEPCDIVLIGASGDLAQTKILPALFSLKCRGFMPPTARIFGFSRTPLEDAEFRRVATEHLTCRYAPPESCGAQMDDFLSRCTTWQALTIPRTPSSICTPE